MPPAAPADDAAAAASLADGVAALRFLSMASAGTDGHAEALRLAAADGAATAGVVTPSAGRDVHRRWTTVFDLTERCLGLAVPRPQRERIFAGDVAATVAALHAVMGQVRGSSARWAAAVREAERQRDASAARRAAAEVAAADALDARMAAHAASAPPPRVPAAANVAATAPPASDAASPPELWRQATVVSDRAAPTRRPNALSPIAAPRRDAGARVDGDGSAAVAVPKVASVTLLVQTAAA